MRNPGDQIVPKAMIRTFQSDFRILDEWTIEYEEDDNLLHIPDKVVQVGPTADTLDAWDRAYRRLWVQSLHPELSP